ncbi:MAG: hypothetical protein HUU50_07925 [Candidatus Brocadiae bacterium]|nr:hypothetical protein [Candidatus Brocadiia bacterium]
MKQNQTPGHAVRKLQAASGFYLNRSLRVNPLSGIKKTGIPFFFLCHAQELNKIF